METAGINLNFAQFPTLAAATRSRAFIRIVIGPAGSGKTSWMFAFVLIKAMEQAAAPDGVRYSRVVIVRNTYDMLQRSTLKTAENVLGTVGKFVQSKPPRGLVEFPMGDGTQVRMELEFMALDSEEGLNRLLGNEMTWIIVDEISEIPEAVIWRSVTRIGRYPSGRYGTPTDCGLVAATNGPKTNHWLYKWYLGAKNKTFRVLGEELKRPYFELYKQPAALLRPKDMTQFDDPAAWLPNPKAENIPNLRGGYKYYVQMLGQGREGEAEIKAYVEGDFAPLKVGEPVFPEFSEDMHVIDNKAFFLQDGMELGISFDFGRTPVGLLWTTLPNGRLVVIDEFMAKNASVDEMMREKFLPVYAEKYSRNMLSWGTGDPAGLIGGQGLGISPYEVLKAPPFLIPMEPPPMDNRIEPRLDSMRTCLKTLVGGGTPMFGVTSNCRFLIDALARTYVYEFKRGNEGMKETPTKEHENWCSDIADAACYGTLYRLSMGRSRKTFTRTQKRRRIA